VKVCEDVGSEMNVHKDLYALRGCLVCGGEFLVPPFCFICP
jgi:hypothetical protein